MEAVAAVRVMELRNDIKMEGDALGVLKKVQKMETDLSSIETIVDEARNSGRVHNMSFHAYKEHRKYSSTYTC